ncbi:unnamed protein product [Nyctereutes procyonoides]|uniref:(raccoon dog) hypothetical protein n=1 Tax=Nyctereutes procyonoides TaxID=34880 RepID=A0A811ZD90_NYCPR|nr:unnamed protein product [Nyctereutes procyonoides]
MRMKVHICEDPAGGSQKKPSLRPQETPSGAAGGVRPQLRRSCPETQESQPGKARQRARRACLATERSVRRPHVFPDIGHLASSLGLQKNHRGGTELPYAPPRRRVSVSRLRAGPAASPRRGPHGEATSVRPSANTDVASPLPGREPGRHSTAEENHLFHQAGSGMLAAGSEAPGCSPPKPRTRLQQKKHRIGTTCGLPKPPFPGGAGQWSLGRSEGLAAWSRTWRSTELVWLLWRPVEMNVTGVWKARLPAARAVGCGRGVAAEDGKGLSVQLSATASGPPGPRGDSSSASL